MCSNYRTLYLVLAVLGPLGSHPALAVGPPRCDDIQLPFDLYVNSPCVGDSVYVTFQSCNQCVDLWSTWWDEATGTLSLNAIYWQQSCDENAHCNPEMLVGFAGLARSVGSVSVRLRVQTSVVYDSVTCVSERFVVRTPRRGKRA